MKEIVRFAAQIGLGMAVGTWIYYAVTRGITADTWYRSVFVGGFVFILEVCVLGLKNRFWPAKRQEF